MLRPRDDLARRAGDPGGSPWPRAVGSLDDRLFAVERLPCEPPRCLNSPGQPARYARFCRRHDCPCPLAGAAGPGVTHGLAERRYQAERFAAGLPSRTGFVTNVVHLARDVSPAELTRAACVVRLAVRRVDPRAAVVQVLHWLAVTGRGAVPHLHVGVWTDLPHGILAFACELTAAVEAARPWVTRGRGRPGKSRNVTKTSPLIGGGGGLRAAVWRDGLPGGGSAAAWVRYALRTLPRQQGQPVPSGHRLMYGRAKARRVCRGAVSADAG